MQSPTQSPSGPNPGATATQEPPLDTETEAQPAQSDSDEQKEKDEPAAPVMTETVTPQENGTEVQTAETPASLPVTQAAENEPAVQPQTEPSVNSAGVETDSASKPSVPSELDTNAKSKCDEKKAKKMDKGVREPRKYIPSKKAMVDPLKMDMSKQPVIPLTCECFNLYCVVHIFLNKTWMGDLFVVKDYSLLTNLNIKATFCSWKVSCFLISQLTLCYNGSHDK